MSIFRFKHFEVSDDGCAMKIGTDAVLLGAWSGVHGTARIKDDKNSSGHILDIGTGCGILALMMAQKTYCDIDAVEIDEDSCMTASVNFSRSAWKDSLVLFREAFQDYTLHCKTRYDLILSNPPFFQDSLLNPGHHRTIARHQVLLGFDELFSGASSLLEKDGAFNLIYPMLSDESVNQEATKNQLFNVHKTYVVPRHGKPPNRILSSFVMKEFAGKTDELIIRYADGSFTEAYRSITKDFYLNF